MLRDLRDAIRGLRRALPVTLTIVACLGFGMGSVTLVYSWYEGLLEHPLPAVRHPDELVTIRAQATAGSSFCSLPEYRDWRDQATSLSDLSASTFSLFGVSLAGDPGVASEPVYGIFASANYFDVLGIEISIGSNFALDDDSPNRQRLAVIVSDRLWRARLRRRADVIGHVIRINGQQATIIGVAPPSFGGTLAGASFDLWVPLAARGTLVPSESGVIESRSHRWLDVVVGRRRPGVSLTQVREQFSAIGTRMADTHTESRGRSIAVGPLDTGSVQQLRPLFVSVLALTVVVLLIVCSNVANMLLVQGASRVRSIAIRLAIGASRAQILRALILENILLAIAGAAAGVALTIAGRGLLLGNTPTMTIPLNLETQVDMRLLMFIIALTSVTVLSFGVLPAVLATRVRITEALGGNARGVTVGRNWVRSALVSAQFALCLTTIVAGTLFLRRAQTLDALDPGFADPSRVLLMQSESALAGYQDMTRWQMTLDAISDRVRRVPGVRSATWASFVPLGFVGYTRRDVAVAGYAPQPGESMQALVSAVGDGYFDLMGIPVLEGRPIRAEDAPGRLPVAVVNEAFARRFWNSAASIGQQITLANRTLTVVGVAKDSRYDYRLLDSPPEPVIYYSISQMPARYAALHVRTATAAAASVTLVRQAIHDADPGFATLAPISLEDYVAGPLTPLRMGIAFLGVLAGASLVLSAMGLQAIVAYGVTMRQREIGIRLTLGASPSAVAHLFLRQTMIMTGSGVAAGLACAAALVPILQHRVAYLGSIGTASVAWPVALLSAVGVIAGYVTVWRSVVWDPAETLRSDG